MTLWATSTRQSERMEVRPGQGKAQQHRNPGRTPGPPSPSLREPARREPALGSAFGAQDQRQQRHRGHRRQERRRSEPGPSEVDSSRLSQHGHLNVSPKELTSDDHTSRRERGAHRASATQKDTPKRLRKERKERSACPAGPGPHPSNPGQRGAPHAWAGPSHPALRHLVGPAVAASKAGPKGFFN